VILIILPARWFTLIENRRTVVRLRNADPWKPGNEP
jgi:hypothetical protein